jgi:hypothetical protein
LVPIQINLAGIFILHFQPVIKNYLNS